MPRLNRKNSKSTTRQLGCERLGDRRLMAADVALANGVLEIEADNASDHILVESVSSASLTSTTAISAKQSLTSRFQLPSTISPIPTRQIKVTVTDANGTSVTTFPAMSVSSLNIEAGGGNDTVDVKVNLPAIIDGGWGNDFLYGGNQDDVIRGGSGNDRLYGRGGNDELRGESGSDRLYGSSGNDLLDGGSSTDYLYGSSGNDELRGGSSRDFLRGDSGNDRLLGQTGNDDLEGGSGNDVLIGGRGSNSLHSGWGHDRYLVMDSEGETIEDQSSADARINFADSVIDLPMVLGSNIGLVWAQSKSWTTADIEEVDESLELLFHTTGNNELLQTSNGGPLKFVRYGDILDLEGDENTSVLGWNGLGEIVVLDNAIENDRLMETVIHEIGHNFDEQSENDYIDDFRDAGGWTELAPWDSTSGMTIASDGLWQGLFGGGWFFPTNRGNEFARNYGKTNPLEDWATAFTAKVMTDAELNYFGESPTSVRSRMSARFDVIDDFFASLS